ncbi:methylated-DNA-protein-cysteine S-methyltransferase [Mycoavidus cysteinexigens]|uniref:Methylated-DNA-protein-cysteine S-methyltransferase n=1 Tax=Mycoavidus cysteinexigens TaxID=1553431 RepID=A0A2Z6EYM9_9BURK|nr:methylated-DNA--[protein]-cysteine S-methyltransferase [Mycoavidus cysteinexigens]BBE10325.1 methylated-DNA-protein-cysteine S-methyltransferase [Mycoavidus cysteinexigens]GAM53303.1 methylated-DNA--protein-cysteine methyltransferase [bacterium endosymbiont of Mortierella elongata FMR23-6]GLR00742.1 methylated-DNA--protein-cysteine methyltransferase [Mycoavidus cysteinexigens]
MHPIATFNAVFTTPFGKVGLRTEANAICEIVYLPNTVQEVSPNNALARQAVRQIERYLKQPSATFDLPLATVGSVFQRRVWQAISEIAPGTVQTYGQLARLIGSAPRAVGQACGSNYFPLVIPCHRVVGANGIGGFAHHAGDGYFRTVKRWLLAHEGVNYNSDSVSSIFKNK